MLSSFVLGLSAFVTCIPSPHPNKRGNLLQKDLRLAIPIEALDIFTAKCTVAGALAWPGQQLDQRMCQRGDISRCNEQARAPIWYHFGYRSCASRHHW